MKKISTIFAGVAVAAVLLSILPSVQAQPAGGPGRGAAMRAGILSDILVLNTEKTEKVTTAYTEAQTKVREKMGQVDFRSMSQEERTKMQQDITAQFKENAKDILSAKELEAAESVLARRIFMPDAQLRALRQIELKDDLRAKLQPLAIELSKSMVTFTPDASDSDREEAQKKYDQEKAKFMTKAGELLSAEQKTAWEAKAKEVQKEFDEMRERMRNRS